MERCFLCHLCYGQESRCQVIPSVHLDVVDELMSLPRYAFIAFGGAGIWTAVPIFLSYMVTNFEGREKRAVSIALINGFGTCCLVTSRCPAEHLV